MAISTDRDKIRLEIGDTDTTAQLFQDDEIQYFLDSYGSVLGAAAAACDAAAAKFARAYDFETDGQRFQRSQMAAMFSARAKALRSRATGVGVIVPTRVDGYSDSIAADEVSTVAATAERPYAGRRRYQPSSSPIY